MVSFGTVFSCVLGGFKSRFLHFIPPARIFPGTTMDPPVAANIGALADAGTVNEVQQIGAEVLDAALAREQAGTEARAVSGHG